MLTIARTAPTRRTRQNATTARRRPAARPLRLTPAPEPVTPTAPQQTCCSWCGQPGAAASGYCSPDCHVLHVLDQEAPREVWGLADVSFGDLPDALGVVGGENGAGAPADCTR